LESSLKDPGGYCQMTGVAMRARNCGFEQSCRDTGKCKHQPNGIEKNPFLPTDDKLLNGSIVEEIPSFDQRVNEFCEKRRADAYNAARQTMPTDSVARKNTPICTGVLDYFPAAIAAVARISKLGNDKHNPGQPLHHARGKSMDHADCAARHLVDRGIIDPDTGESHTAEAAWRILALLQEEEEARGAPRARAAR
jgi:hypothetical protein